MREEENITQQLAKMTISKKPYSMDIQCPYIVYEYLDYGKTVATIDFLVPNQHRRFFALEILDNKQLQLKITVPDLFYDPARLMLQCGHKRNFHKNSAKATVFQKQCKELKKKEGVKTKRQTTDGDVEEITEVHSSVQCIELPFPVEEELYKGHMGKGEGFEVFILENDDEVLLLEMEEGDSTDFFLLSVDVVKLEEKEKKKTKGLMRRVATANRKTLAAREDSDSEAEVEEEGERQEMQEGDE